MIKKNRKEGFQDKTQTPITRFFENRTRTGSLDSSGKRKFSPENAEMFKKAKLGNQTKDGDL